MEAGHSAEIEMKPGFIQAKSLFSCLFLVGVLGFATNSRAAELSGNIQLGLWYLQNNISSVSGFLPDDQYGSSYIHDHYALMNWRTRAQVKNLLGSSTRSRLNAHVDGRILINLLNDDYAFGVPNRTRQQIDEMAFEWSEVSTDLDLWVGRQTLYPAGGNSLDGARLIYGITPDLDLALYGGLGNDPRNLTGYIGPAYRSNPFTGDFYSAGAYASYRTEALRSDSAFNLLLFKGDIDRATLFQQVSYRYSAFWTFSGYVEVGVAGDVGLPKTQVNVIARPEPWVTNTLSYSRFRSLVYNQSAVSATPVPAGIDASLVGGNDVSTSTYQSVRDHVRFKVWGRKFFFAALEFARRGFDDENRFKYTAGYRDPSIAGSDFDFRLQGDVIDNFRGFNWAIDGLLGKDFDQGKVRAEIGGTFYTNERQQFLNNQVVSGVEESEREFSVRLNGYYTPIKKLSLFLNYSLHQETDVVNLEQKIWTHELYLQSYYKF